MTIMTPSDGATPQSFLIRTLLCLFTKVVATFYTFPFD